MWSKLLTGSRTSTWSISPLKVAGNYRGLTQICIDGDASLDSHKVFLYEVVWVVVILIHELNNTNASMLNVITPQKAENTGELGEKGSFG